jgi:gliding motility-associated lipoprotein GldH
MNTLKSIILVLSSILILSSCDSRRILYQERLSFGEEMVWKKSDTKTFTIEVKENKHPFELVLELRYITAYPYDKLLLHIFETDPSGKKIRKDVDVQIRESNGEFIGDKGLDIIDLEFILDGNKAYPSFGTYTYEISQVMPEVETLPGVMEIGLILRDQEKEEK